MKERVEFPPPPLSSHGLKAGCVIGLQLQPHSQPGILDTDKVEGEEGGCKITFLQLLDSTLKKKSERKMLRTV